MRCPAALLVLALALGMLPPGVGAARAEAPGCGAPPETLEAQPLPGAFAAVNRGALRILVVGSASAAIAGGSPGEAPWPVRLQALLSDWLAPATVQVETFGGRGTTAADHARILETEGQRFRPHLVIWQLGTVEATRHLPPEEMSAIVQEVAARIRARRGELTDLVLMDMQFSRFLRANANVEAYRDQLRMAAAAGGAQLLSRWTIMRHWVETERLDLERAPRGQRTAVMGALQDCLARVVGAFVLEGTKRERR